MEAEAEPCEASLKDTKDFAFANKPLFPSFYTLTIPQFSHPFQKLVSFFLFMSSHSKLFSIDGFPSILKGLLLL